MNVKEKVETIRLCCSSCGKSLCSDTSDVSEEAGSQCQCPKTEEQLASAGQTAVETRVEVSPEAKPEGPDSASIEGPAKSASIEGTPVSDESLVDSNYTILGKLGSGGMGTVYKVRDEKLQKDFAMKMLHAEFAKDQVSLKRFSNEIEAVSQLSHWNLVGIYNHGVNREGSPYFIMDCIDGTSLSEILKKEQRIRSERALKIFIQICEALAHAHMKGIVHRDLKPSNVLITKNADGLEIVKIVDFGVARLFPSAEIRQTTNLTRTGDVLGTPVYMSPEQCMGLKTDERSDIYSLGCLMHETLTGTPPFVGENPIQIIAQHLNEMAEDFAVSENSQLLKGLQAVTNKAMAKAPEERYQNMDELRLDLEKVRDGQKNISAVKKPQRRVHFKHLIALYVSIVLQFGAMLFLVAYPLSHANLVPPTFTQLPELVSKARENVELFDAYHTEECARDFASSEQGIACGVRDLELIVQDSDMPPAKAKQLAQTVTSTMQILNELWAQDLNGKSSSGLSVAQLKERLNKTQIDLKVQAQELADEITARSDDFWRIYKWIAGIGLTLLSATLLCTIFSMNKLQYQVWYQKRRRMERFGAKGKS